MSCVDSKSVPFAVVIVNIVLAAVDVDIWGRIMSGVDCKLVPYVVVPVNIGLAFVDVAIGIVFGVDS